MTDERINMKICKELDLRLDVGKVNIESLKNQLD